jgi:CheY-like chemotaxis protein
MNKQNPPSILLVEDDVETRDILANVLALKFPAFVIHTADNGLKAVECFKKYGSPIVVTDVNMPVMDGISTAREIKSIDPNVKLIVLTAFSDKSILVYTKAIEIEIDHYIPKPTEYGELFAAVEQCIATVSTDSGLAGLTRRGDEKTKQPETAPDKEAPATADPPAVAAQTSPIPGPNMRVLLVEDDVLARETTKDLLESYGYEVFLADSGKTALNQLEAFHPGVVLLDIGLPDMSGYQLARHLRDLPGGNDLLLVAISGYGQTEDLLRARKAGFDHHLLKPFIFTPLRELLSLRAQSLGLA